MIINEFKMQFANPPNPDYEEGGGEKLVDPSGYITAEEQIMSMLQAGIRLDESRRELYDYDGGEDVEFSQVPYDITRTPGIDMAELSQIKLMADKNIKNSIERAKAEEGKKSLEEGK